MATFTVNTTADVVDGNYSQLSLREAVNRANGTTAADTIVFAGALDGENLVLTGGELILSQDVTIDGDQNNDGVRVTLDGNREGFDTGTRHFKIEGLGTSVNLTDLDFVKGNGGYESGGSISVLRSTVAVTNCHFTGNYAGSYEYGGAIFVEYGGALTVTQSEFSDNYAQEGGGAIGRTTHRGPWFQSEAAALRIIDQVGIPFIPPAATDIVDG